MPHKQRSQKYFNFVQNTKRGKQVFCEFFGFDFASWCLANNSIVNTNQDISIQREMYYTYR